jgi:two-component system response regulator GlrR
MVHILIVDDDDDFRYLVCSFLKKLDAKVFEANDGAKGLEIIQKESINLLITDLIMPHMTGEELVENVKKINPRLLIVVMTSNASLESAVDLMQKGADDYITKPFTEKGFLARVGKTLEKLMLQQKIEQLEREVNRQFLKQPFIGSSKQMIDIIKKSNSVSKTDASVLIDGESGTGKEVLARFIHSQSLRASNPFVSVNCGAIPSELIENELFGHLRGAYTGANDNRIGLIQEANEGTIFLDEIGELGLSMQVKFLRFLQEKEFKPLGDTRTYKANVRIIAATNKDLRKLVREGKFREDLYYRLNIFPITLPPLRERKDDLPLLINHFLKRSAQEFGKDNLSISPMSLQKLMTYDWPGNIRELENKIQQIVLMAEKSVIVPEEIIFYDSPPTRENVAIPFKIDINVPLKQAKNDIVSDFEHSYIKKLLIYTGGNISAAARIARKNRRAFWQLIKKYRINTEECKNTPYSQNQVSAESLNLQEEAY